LRFFIPDADDLFDMQRGFVFLDKELEQLFPPEGDAYDNRNVDKLVQVYTQAGEEQWILVHVEVQGHYDASFDERMFLYFARIYDKYRRPITAFAILTDAGKAYRPSSFQRHLLGTSLIYQFNSYKVLDQGQIGPVIGNQVEAVAVYRVFGAGNVLVNFGQYALGHPNGDTFVGVVAVFFRGRLLSRYVSRRRSLGGRARQRKRSAAR
jgi:hypothetical protein